MACIKHTPCQHDSHDHNVMIYVEVYRFSANLRAIRSRGVLSIQGKGRAVRPTFGTEAGGAITRAGIRT